MKVLGLAVSEEMSFEAIVDDTRRTSHDGRRTLTDGNSSPSASGSGELKSRTFQNIKKKKYSELDTRKNV